MDTQKRKVVLMEKNQFVGLIKNYHRGLHLVNLISHICHQYDTELVLTLEEICGLLPVTAERIIAERDRVYVRCSCLGGILFYRIGDILRIVINMESDDLQRRVEGLAVTLESME